MLSLKQVKKSYETFSLDVSFDIHPNEVVGVIGRNGAGKSTTFKAILNLIHSDSGTITLFDKPVGKLQPNDKQKIGVSLLNTGFSETFTPVQISTIMSAFYPDFEPTKFLNKLKARSLPIEKPIKDYSTGMQALFKVLLALSYQATFLILDEPTTGLDVVVRQQIIELLQDYMNQQHDRSILISSHISSDLEKLCDRLIMIDGGRIILQDTTDALLADYGILKVTPEQYQQLDQKYLETVKPTNYGYACFTKQVAYYRENFPGIAIDQGSIDNLILFLTEGDSK